MKGRLLLVASLAWCALAPAQTRVSANYGITTEALDGGGGPATSASYGHQGSVGLISGTATSAAYSLSGGFVAQLGSPPAGPEIAVFDGAVASPAAERQSAGGFRFADTAAGASSPQTFTIKNTGTTDLTGLAVTMTGTNAGDFGPGALGTVTLVPDATATFTVTFSPSVSGARTAVVQIASNDPDENPFVINLRGNDVVAATYTTGAEVPLAVNGYTATGGTVNLALNFAPAVGTQLMVVKNTGLGFITGRFNNLAQGQVVPLSYGGNTYYFVANYYGGSGNDLVLVWAANRVFATGQNADGQIGDNTTTQRYAPVLVTSTGVLAGKTVLALARGAAHSLALCSDGTLAAWGRNTDGQLGDGTTVERDTPVAVTISGTPLEGRTVVAIAAGDSHSLALCSDGTVVAWGYNAGGQLGDGTVTSRSVPVAVTTAATPLAGKSVVAIAAGRHHSVALCDDGTLAAWGLNFYGELGDGSETDRHVPVAVMTAGTPLGGTTVTAVSAGAYHTLVLCADGTLAAWGDNTHGQLGNADTVQRDSAVAVFTGVPALTGKTVVAIAAGAGHNLALCADGSIAGWGDNTSGQLGTGSTSASPSPVATAVSAQAGVSALFGKTVVGIAAGNAYSLAVGADGTLAAWGANANGQLGDNSNAARSLPVAANTSFLVAGEKFILAGTGGYADHTLALVASPPLPEITVFNGASTAPADEIPSGSGSLSFPLTQTGGSSAAQTITIKNTGTADLTGLGVTLTGTNPGDFTLGSLGAVSLAPNASTTFTVTFTPTVDGARSAAVQIASNDPDENPFGIAVSGTGQAVVATYNAATDVPVSASSFDATGKTATLTLNFVPPAGTQLTVVRNTGAGFITGNFTNLAQGQTVALSYGGTAYNFVVNYYGGTGNDLVLVWALSHPFAWGQNASGQLGDGTTTSRSQPVAVSLAGVLAGKTVVALASGQSHSLALCSDGTLAAWGLNDHGQLGIGTMTPSLVPVAVTTAGTSLAGKTVVAIAAGASHSMALCSDGTVSSWGFNSYGQLGNGTTTDQVLPVAVSAAGVLSGKTVTSVAAGYLFSLALCSDGTVSSWGYNSNGQLGASGGGDSSVPVAVWTAGILSGKTVVSIAANVNHTLALCSDGTLVSWGFNYAGALGDGTLNDQPAPVPVSVSGTLSGKTVVAVAVGDHHNLVLCSDGSLVSWGLNSSGQLGDGSMNDFGLPLLVTKTGTPLASRTIAAVATGDSHCLVICSDGTLVAWGGNGSGQLGDGTTTQRTLALAVDTTTLGTGDHFSRAISGSFSEHTLALVGSPLPAPEISVFDGTGGSERQSNTGNASFADTLIGANSAAQTFTIQNTGAMTLDSLALAKAGANPGDFILGSLGATTLAPGATTTFTVTFSPTAAGVRAAVVQIASNDTDENPFLINIGGNGVGAGQAVVATFNTAADVPVTASSYSATGKTVNLTLNFAPAAGTQLMLVRNTGVGFITGNFANLVQGQAVALSYGGATYDFVANYYGGTGNDLVLVWALSHPFGWGLNASGQLGDGTTTSRSQPGAVTASGVLAGKTVVAVANGQSHSLALCSDGTLAAWGLNDHGQLGIGTTTPSLVPVAVTTAGTPLAGKTVVAIAAGTSHSLALCSDGTVRSWGYNAYGQLGDGSLADRLLPVAVTTTGVLSGKTVVNIAAGYVFSLALCSDGTVKSWGYNVNGQLGNLAGSNSSVPVNVSTAGALSGKTVASLSTNVNHTLALCSDGTLVSWGFNFAGELGDGTTDTQPGPVLVQVSGILAGKTVVATAAGDHHSLALCSDGTLAAWGLNSSGQLGNGSTTDLYSPGPVTTTGTPLAARTIVGITAGDSHCLVICSDGTLVAWGGNGSGQLGDGTTAQSTLAVAVDTTILGTGEHFSRVASGSFADFSLALVGSPILVPEISVFDGNGTGGAERQSNTGSAGFTDTLVGATSSAQTFTIQNTGTASLTGLALSLTGANAGDFILSSLGATSLAPGDTTTFTVTFLPTMAGARAAVVQIASNDADENPFLINVGGDGLTALSNWRAVHFGSAADSGNGANTADPDGDGFTNLMEYALGLDPLVASTTGLPVVSTTATDWVYTYTRPASATDVTYAVEISTDLATWTTVNVTHEIVSSSAGVETWHALYPLNLAPNVFFRLKVTAP